MPVSRLGVAMVVVLHLNLRPSTLLVHHLLLLVLLVFKLPRVKSIEFVFHRPGLLLLVTVARRRPLLLIPILVSGRHVPSWFPEFLIPGHVQLV